MQIVPILLAVSAGPSAKRELTVDDFKDYQGSREVLKEALFISGTLTSKLTGKEKCLAEIFTPEHLLHIAATLDADDYERLGGMLSELSGARFDSFCHLLESAVFQGLDRTFHHIVKGYQGISSRFKSASSISAEEPVTIENAPYQRKNYEEVCRLLVKYYMVSPVGSVFSFGEMRGSII